MSANRRDFMRTAGLGAALMPLGVSAARAAVPPPAKWDAETDVLVVGYGGAGSVTAIEAADHGAQVLVLEKNPANQHVCNTNVSGGVFIYATDPDKAFAYVKACLGDTVGDDLCRQWCERTAENPDYVRRLADAVGVPSELIRYGGAEFPELPGAQALTASLMKAGGGSKIFEVLDKNVKARPGIRVEFSTPAKRIVQGANGEVLGIIAQRDGKDFAVRGKRATVLACGGYEYAEQIKRNAFFGNPRYFYGTDSNTGDGVTMAMAAGADLWHMNWSSQGIGFSYKNFPVAFPFDGASKPNYMVVDQYGKRFFDETRHGGHTSYLFLIHYDPVKGTFPRLPAFLIFDETFRTMGVPMASSIGVGHAPWGARTVKYNYTWSKDQSAEIEKGWIMKADTIEELAARINARQGPNELSEYHSPLRMDPAVLAASIKTYNANAANREDPEFGRHQPGPVVTAPFYATELWPCGFNTQGGPRFNVKGQVLDAFGAPIPRLYKCGELGSIYGEHYPGGGGNITELLAFGRVVGENAARESAAS